MLPQACECFRMAMCPPAVAPSDHDGATRTGDAAGSHLGARRVVAPVTHGWHAHDLAAPEGGSASHCVRRHPPPSPHTATTHPRPHPTPRTNKVASDHLTCAASRSPHFAAAEGLVC